MAEMGTVLAAQPANLILSSRTYIVGGENGLSQKLSSDILCTRACSALHPSNFKVQFKKF